MRSALIGRGIVPRDLPAQRVRRFRCKHRNDANAIVDVTCPEHWRGAQARGLE